jgi:tRNA(fMet)-specific endonuclease VapC
MFALDTNTVIYFFKGVGQVQERLLATPPSEIAIPAVVVYELEAGIAQSTQPGKRRTQLDELLGIVRVLPLDKAGAKAAAQAEAVLRAAGKPIGPMDTLIAGIAIAHHATLVTRNTGEFRRVRGLSVVDWY